MEKYRQLAVIFISIGLLLIINNQSQAAEKSLNEQLDSIKDYSIIKNQSTEKKEPNKTEKTDNSSSSSAKKKQADYTSGWGWFVGPYYTTYDTTMTLHGLKWAKHNENLRSGMGVQGGIKYKFNQQVSINGGADYTCSYNDDLKLTLFAPYTELNLTCFDNLINLTTGVGKYYYKFFQEYETLYGTNTNEIHAGSKIGYLIGGQISIPPRPYKYYLKLGVKYRLLNNLKISRIEGEQGSGLKINMSGWKFSLKWCKKF